MKLQTTKIMPNLQGNWTTSNTVLVSAWRNQYNLKTVILRFNYLNSCIWLITDHKLAIEDKFVRLEPADINTIDPTTT